MTTIDLDNRQVLDAFNRLVNAVDNPEPALQSVGRILKTRIQQGFIAGRAPDGTPWAPPKHRKGQPLRDTGRLMNSIDYATEPDAVEVGTNVVYAAIHNFGGPTGRRNPKSGNRPIMPQRQFIPTQALPEDWAADVLDEFNHFLEAGLQGR